MSELENQGDQETQRTLGQLQNRGHKAVRFTRSQAASQNREQKAVRVTRTRASSQNQERKPDGLFGIQVNWNQAGLIPGRKKKHSKVSHSTKTIEQSVSVRQGSK